MAEPGGSDLRHQLEEEIVTGALLPGSRLDEQGLARRFSVSRTPIREALLQLEAIGLVEIRPRRGAIVSSPGPQRLIEMFEMMAELEACCGRLAARRLDDDDLRALREAHMQCEEAASLGDIERYYDVNAVFHQTIYRAAHNTFLFEQALALHRRLAPYRRLQLRARNRVSQSIAEHAAIVAALEAGDGARADATLRDHVLIQGERFADVMMSLNALGASA